MKVYHPGKLGNDRVGQRQIEKAETFDDLSLLNVSLPPYSFAGRINPLTFPFTSSSIISYPNF